jgi:hypothetical protein
MNSKQRKVLKAIFENPTRRDIAWADIEGLLVSVGCRVIAGGGSHVRIVHGTLVTSFSRPHPAKEAKQYQVRDARRLLETIGIKP